MHPVSKQVSRPESRAESKSAIVSVKPGDHPRIVAEALDPLLSAVLVRIVLDYDQPVAAFAAGVKKRRDESSQSYPLVLDDCDRSNKALKAWLHKPSADTLAKLLRSSERMYMRDEAANVVALREWDKSWVGDLSVGDIVKLAEATPSILDEEFCSDHLPSFLKSFTLVGRRCSSVFLTCSLKARPATKD
jgi:hypothetical protein